jgi:hypothetical protein
MVLAVHLDVAFQIPHELGQVPVHFAIQIAHYRLEHARNGVLPSEGEGSGLRSQRTIPNHVERCLHKPSSRYRRTIQVETLRNAVQHAPNRFRTRPSPFHRFQVDLEVTHWTALILVTLLAEND